jgi:periplasmic divalent cation tolerance protein
VDEESHLLIKMHFYLIFTTVPSKKEAQKLALSSLDHKLAACVHIAPVGESFYWWKGKKEKAKEISLTFKTTKKALSPLMKMIKNYHSYQTPEILAVRVEKGDPAYLKWVKQETNF